MLGTKGLYCSNIIYKSLDLPETPLNAFLRNWSLKQESLINEDMITKSVISVKEALLLFTKLPSYGYRIPQENIFGESGTVPNFSQKGRGI